jgi:uncharacterized protein YigE (DUF2233 family)
MGIDANYWTSDDTSGKVDPIVEKVKRSYDLRSAVGITKYGTTLEDSPDGFYEFLNHLQQELMDATLYIEKLKSQTYATKNATKKV